MRPKILLTLLVIAGIAYFLYLSEGAVGIKEGDRAPVFTLPSQSGSISLEGLRGKVILVNFWATWCPPCVEEMPSLENLNSKFEGKEFVLLAINLDEEGWKAVERFTERRPLTLTILADPKGDVASQYGTYRLPESFLIDKDGKVVRKYTGPRQWTDTKIVAEIRGYVEGS